MSLFRRNKQTTAQHEAEERELEQFKSTINARLGYVDTDEQSEALYNVQLLMTAAQLANSCHTTGASPKEVLATYTELAEGLRDWFNLVPLRKKLEAMLDEKAHKGTTSDAHLHSHTEEKASYGEWERVSWFLAEINETLLVKGLWPTS